MKSAQVHEPTCSRAGVISRAGPQRNCLWMSQVALSFTNLWEKSRKKKPSSLTEKKNVSKAQSCIFSPNDCSNTYNRIQWFEDRSQITLPDSSGQLFKYHLWLYRSLFKWINTCCFHTIFHLGVAKCSRSSLYCWPWVDFSNNLLPCSRFLFFLIAFNWQQL